MLIGKRMFYNGNRSYILALYCNGKNSFDIKSFIESMLPDKRLVNTIPDIYWKCFIPVFSGISINMEGCLNNCGYYIDNSICSEITSNFIRLSPGTDLGIHNDSINHYGQKIERKFRDNYYYSVFYSKAYHQLMTYFFTLPNKDGNIILNILSPIDGYYYSEVGYITLLGEKADYLERFITSNNKNSFLQWQSAFLQILNHQIYVF